MCSTLIDKRACEREGITTDTTFDELYAAHFPYVRKFLLRLCKGDEYTANDLAQETFFQAYIGIGRFEGKCRVETWLCSIAQNVFYAYLKKEKKQRRVAEKQEREIQAGEADFTQEEKYLAHDVSVALKQLPPRTAQVLSLRLFHDTPYAEIAGLLGITENSAKVIYHRGRVKLKEILGKEYGHAF